ncbi:hypothetical protein MRB53_029473 [Persea americana]|uniref:Uncharacterized protein n=1 Tax=Persea americana TaxID=3435 RepID=A0ACC2KIG4_PERAE|nr:hypothetical protein MRB53_029473 [Persea americana]
MYKAPKEMADEGLISHRRDPIKSSVGNIASMRRRQHAVSVGKERREALVRTKRFCRDGFVEKCDSSDREMIIDEEQAELDAQTTRTVEELKSSVLYQGKGAVQKKVDLLRDLRRLLSRSEIPPIEAALQAGAIPILAQCLSFGSPDEQLLEAAWCLTNIAAGEPEQTKALLPALPLLVAHLGEKSSMPVAEQCAWALGNVAGECEELRNILLAQGALLSLARMMQSNKSSTARTAAWALSNLIKGPDPEASTELIRIDGVLDSIIRHLRNAQVDEELATELAWVIVYLSALSNTATAAIVKTDIVQLLVQTLAAANSLQLLIPVLRSLGNLVAGDSHTTSAVLVAGHDITGSTILALIKCLKSEHRVLKKEAAWVLSNIAAGSIAHKQILFRMEGAGLPNVILEHLVALVKAGCLPGFITMVRSPDIEAARLGLQFLELVMRGLPNGEGPKLVEQGDGIDAMERKMAPATSVLNVQTLKAAGAIFPAKETLYVHPWYFDRMIVG